MNPPKFTEKDYIGINGVGKDQLDHPHFEKYQDYFIKYYKIRDEIKTAVFLPCAAIKPYYNSPIHKTINRTIDKYDSVQKFVISNAGIIPYEYCDKYPFDSYDWNPLFENKKIRKLYILKNSERIFNFFMNKNIKNKIKFISYLRNDSESLQALKNAFKKLKFNLIIIKIEGSIHKTADTDLLLILKHNLNSLDKELKME